MRSIYQHMTFDYQQVSQSLERLFSMVEDVARTAYSSHVMSLAEQPPNFTKSANRTTSADIAGILDRWMQANDSRPGSSFLLPSLSSLSVYFSVPESDIRNALHHLKYRGYDTVCPGMYGNISVWRHDATEDSEGHRISHVDREAFAMP